MEGGRSVAEADRNPPSQIAPLARRAAADAATDDSSPVWMRLTSFSALTAFAATRWGRPGSILQRNFSPCLSSCTVPSRSVRTITFLPARLSGSCCRSN